MDFCLPLVDKLKTHDYKNNSTQVHAAHRLSAKEIILKTTFAQDAQFYMIAALKSETKIVTLHF